MHIFVGLGYPRPIDEDESLKRWKTVVGDVLQEHVGCTLSQEILYDARQLK